MKNTKIQLPAFFILIFAILVCPIMIQPSHAGTIEVEYPNENRVYKPGDWMMIRWRTRDIQNNINIGLYKDGREYWAIKTNLDPGRVSYRWKVGEFPTPGPMPPGEYRIYIVEMGGHSSDLSDQPFTINETGVQTSASACDYAVQSATLNNGQPIDHGVDHPHPHTPLRTRIKALIIWNGVNPVSRYQESHKIEVRSSLTNEVLSTRAQATFSHNNANHKNAIRHDVNLYISGSEIPQVRRGRYIPLKLIMIPSPGSADAIARNNTKEVNLRINTPTPNDLAVKIKRSDTRLTRKYRFKTPYSKKVKLKINQRVYFRNLSRTESGATPVARDVKITLSVYPPQGNRVYFYKRKTIARISNSEWAFTHITGEWNASEVDGRGNFRVEVKIDPDYKFYDPNRRNNHDAFQTHYTK